MSHNPFEEISQLLMEIKKQLENVNLKQHKPIEIIDRDELCKRLSITRPTAIRWEQRGKIPCFRIGSNVRYNWFSVVAALENP